MEPLSLPEVSSNPQINPVLLVLKSPTTGTVTALALAILTAFVAVRHGDFRTFSAILIGAATGFVAKLIHDAFFILPESGMGPEALREELKSNLYTMYAKHGIDGREAAFIVEEKVVTIFNKISETLAELDKACQKGFSHRLILPNGNYNDLTIRLELGLGTGIIHKEEIKIGSGSFYNILTIDVVSLEHQEEGVGAKAKLRVG